MVMTPLKCLTWKMPTDCAQKLWLQLVLQTAFLRPLGLCWEKLPLSAKKAVVTATQKQMVGRWLQLVLSISLAFPTLSLSMTLLLYLLLAKRSLARHHSFLWVEWWSWDPAFQSEETYLTFNKHLQTIMSLFLFRTDIQGSCMVQVKEETGISIGGKKKDNSLSKNTYLFSIPEMKFSDGPSLIKGRILHSCGTVLDSSNPGLRWCIDK